MILLDENTSVYLQLGECLAEWKERHSVSLATCEE